MHAYNVNMTSVTEDIIDQGIPCFHKYSSKWQTNIHLYVTDNRLGLDPASNT